MWENALYVGGDDDGVIEAGDLTRRRSALLGVHAQRDGAPAARARRSCDGRIQLVERSRSGRQAAYTQLAQAANAATATRAPSVFGRYVGAPVAHAAITGAFSCPMPEVPAVTYHGRFEGGAQITDAHGRVLAGREGSEGSGNVIADVEAQRTEPRELVPERFWLHRRGAVAAIARYTQRLLGRRWYARHVRGRPPLMLDSAPVRAGRGSESLARVSSP